MIYTHAPTNTPTYIFIVTHKHTYARTHSHIHKVWVFSFPKVCVRVSSQFLSALNWKVELHFERGHKSSIRFVMFCLNFKFESMCEKIHLFFGNFATFMFQGRASMLKISAVYSVCKHKRPWLALQQGPFRKCTVTIIYYIMYHCLR